MRSGVGGGRHAIWGGAVLPSHSGDLRAKLVTPELQPGKRRWQGGVGVGWGEQETEDEFLDGPNFSLILGYPVILKEP